MPQKGPRGQGKLGGATALATSFTLNFAVVFACWPALKKNGQRGLLRMLVPASAPEGNCLLLTAQAAYIR